MSKLSENNFVELMNSLAEAWSTQNTEKALSCFNVGAIYMEPPDIQFYQGHEQLQAYFDALEPGTFMIFHNLWFNSEQQSGAGEFSFGITENPTSDHGIIVVEFKEGKISFWREYQQKGPTNFHTYLDHENKTWQWHIGNYP